MRRKDLRFPLPRRFSARLAGRRVDEVARRAKYLLSTSTTVRSSSPHLGMTGRFTVVAPSGAYVSLGEEYSVASPGGAAKVCTITWSSTSTTARASSTTIRAASASWTWPVAGQLAAHRLLRGLGAEPLSDDFDATAWRACSRGRGRRSRPHFSTSAASPASATSMSARLSIGPACRRAGAPAAWSEGAVPIRGSPLLAAAVRAVLNDAIAAGGSTLRDYAGADGSPGHFQDRFDVYERQGEPCRRPGCRGRIKRIVQAGRSTFFCPVCQK